MFLRNFSGTIGALAIVGCGSIPTQPPVSGTPLRPTNPSHTPEVASIRAISPTEMQKYGGIMTIHSKQIGKILGTCHFGKVSIPSTEEVRRAYERKNNKTWNSTGGDTYTVTATHCIRETEKVGPHGDMDVVAVRSLNRLFEKSDVEFRTIDRPPILERSPYDERSIGSNTLKINSCIPNPSNNTSYCFQISGRSYSNGMYGQRSIYFRIADIIPFLSQAGRSCGNSAYASGTSGMIVVDTSDKAYGVVSNTLDVCHAARRGAINSVLNIEPLRNTSNSLPGQAGKTIIIPN